MLVASCHTCTMHLHLHSSFISMYIIRLFTPSTQNLASLILLICSLPYPELHAGGLFSATAQQGDHLIPLQVTESNHGPRTATARLQLEHAGKWLVTVMHACPSGPTEAAPTSLTSHQVVVEEAAASAACSRLTGFWPAQGAIAGVPAAFTIQVRSLHTVWPLPACLHPGCIHHPHGPTTLSMSCACLLAPPGCFWVQWAPTAMPSGVDLSFLSCLPACHRQTPC